MPDPSGPRPWPGCDTNSEAWRRYCEAWSWVFDKRPKALGQRIEEVRGKEGADLLRRCIRVVKREYRGEIDDRATLPDLLV